MVEIKLRKKITQSNLELTTYVLSKKQYNQLILKEKEDQFTENIKFEENLVFYSLSFGYCLIGKKADITLQSKEVWTVRCHLERGSVLDIYMSQDEIESLVYQNAEVYNNKGKLKGYLRSHFKAILS